jgi:hypothetical protein
MRDFLAVCGVVVLAVCLGVTAAYLSVDFTPPGLDLIRPLKPELAAQMEVQEQQNSIRAEASGCKYCVTVANLAQRFARHARSARQQANALRRTISVERKEAVRQDELVRAEKSADSAEAAAAALTGWASRCRSEDFCRLPAKRQAAATCGEDAAASVTAAYELAAALKRTASACAGASCPQIDCQASASLRRDVLSLERSLTGMGGSADASARGLQAGQLPVGAATFAAEVKRVSDDATYISRMLPVLLESAESRRLKGELPRLAAGLVDDRAIGISQLASVLEHSAEIAGNARNDLRSEASWRVKAIAASLGELGRETETKDVASINWRVAADHLGAALLDVARLQAILVRDGARQAGGTACEAAAPEAAQQLRQAMAMLDLCRMRSACQSRGGDASKPAAMTVVASRAQQLLSSLTVQDINAPSLVDVSQAADARPIDVVRTQYGVCTKASELREASAPAPGAASEVASTAAPGVQPAVAPQDLVTGAANAAVQVSAPAPNGMPALMEASAPAVDRAAPDDAVEDAEAAPDAAASPMFSGSLLTPGGAPALVSTPPAGDAEGRRQ